MTDDEREKIISAACETIARVKDVEVPREEPPRRESSRRLAPVCGDDAVREWARKADAATAERERTRAEIASASNASWSAIDARIEAAIERERELIWDVVGAMFAEHSKANRSDELAKEVADLWRSIAEVQRKIVDIHREALANDRARVVDMSSRPLRGVN